MLSRRWATLSQKQASITSSPGTRISSGSVGPVGRDRRQRPPRGREPEVGVEPALEQLEVVGGDEEGADRDERRDRPRDRHHAEHPERDRTGQRQRGDRDQRAIGEMSPERSAVQLVERVGAETDTEEERAQGCGKPAAVQGGRRGRAERHVAQMPARVRQVQELDTRSRQPPGRRV